MHAVRIRTLAPYETEVYYSQCVPSWAQPSRAIDKELNEEKWSEKQREFKSISVCCRVYTNFWYAYSDGWDIERQRCRENSDTLEFKLIQSNESMCLLCHNFTLCVTLSVLDVEVFPLLQRRFYITSICSIGSILSLTQ